MIIGGLFLQEFVDGAAWAHLDIAGPAFAEKDLPHSPRGGTGFGVRLLACDPYITLTPEERARFGGIELVSRERLLRESDVVVCHVPLTDETRHMVDRRFLAQMKPTAYLINVARGGCVDEPAMLEALRAGQIAGAGIDHFWDEPLPAEKIGGM